MENIREAFLENGHPLTIHEQKNDSFYCCLFTAKYNSKHPVTPKNSTQMQNELFEFEKKNANYFHLFLPNCIECDGNHLAVDCLTEDFKKLKEERRPPSPRECFAAADLLQRCICIVQCKVNDQFDFQRLQAYIFAPMNKNVQHMEPVCILMSLNGFSVEFSNISCTDLKSCPGNKRNEQHTHCFGSRFANNFSALFDNDFNISGTDNNVLTRDLYEHISLTLYGTVNHDKRILNTICNFELEEDNVELFFKYIDNENNEEISVKGKRNHLKTHVEDVKTRSKLGEGEFYALSSAFNVDIIVDKTGNSDWIKYMPVVCTNICCFESPIFLQKDETGFETYKKTLGTCSCCEEKPQIQGNIGKIPDNIYAMVFKNPCCPPKGRKYNHTHLGHLSNIRNEWPQVFEYIRPNNNIERVIAALKIEGRRLDQINGGKGTLLMALAKELYGDEHTEPARRMELLDAMGDEEEDFNFERKLQGVSDWLEVPIFVCDGIENTDLKNDHKSCLWANYEPNMSNNKNCRFYITLFYNKSENVFDRIAPLKGCNCQMPSPLSLFQSTKEMNNQLECVHAEERHDHLVTFLSEDPEINKFENDARHFPNCSSFSSEEIVVKRDDMKERAIDCVKARHSFLRCLSKEIFGTERHVDVVKTDLLNELSQNIKLYIPFIGDDIQKAGKAFLGKVHSNTKGLNILTQFLKERIEDDLPCDELLLWLACTFFQTSIYVLRIAETKTSTESFWVEYTKVRTKRRYSSMTTNFERQRTESKKYYITLIETGSKQYHRIVPRMQACNCCLHAPSVPNYKDDSTQYTNQQDQNQMKLIRKIKNQLQTVAIIIEHWLYCNKVLQQKCDALVLEIESRRKNVNIASLSGFGSLLIGSVLGGVGIAFALPTAGVTLGLTIGGAALAASGGTVSAGAKITEYILNRETNKLLKRYQNGYEEMLESLKTALNQLREDLDKLEELSKEILADQNPEVSNFSNLQSIPGIVRAAGGLTMIPISILRLTTTTISILGSVILPLTAFIDIGMLIFTIRNMKKGNKTDMTENLRRVSVNLYESRRQLYYWAYGNQKPFNFDSGTFNENIANLL